MFAFKMIIGCAGLGIFFEPKSSGQIAGAVVLCPLTWVLAGVHPVRQVYSISHDHFNANSMASASCAKQNLYNQWASRPPQKHAQSPSRWPITSHRLPRWNWHQRPASTCFRSSIQTSWSSLLNPRLYLRFCAEFITSIWEKITWHLFCAWIWNDTLCYGIDFPN